MNEFFKRLLVGIIILISIVFIPYFFKDEGIVVLVAILSLVGLGEFYKIFNDDTLLKWGKKIGALVACYYLLSLMMEIEFKFLTMIFIVVILLIMLFDNLKGEEAGLLAVGFLYVPFLFSHLINENNPEAFYMTFAIAFATDTFAYAGGLLLGRHKLCPKISPKKTVEGAVSGIIGAVIVCVIYRYFICESIGIIYIIFIIIASIFSQLGDLSASLWKRKYGIKDYGTLLPGHGGVLDRFDSVLFVAPIVHYYYVFIQ